MNKGLYNKIKGYENNDYSILISMCGVGVNISIFYSEYCKQKFANYFV